MAKGDQPRAQKTVTQEGERAQNYLGGQQQQVGSTANQMRNVYFGQQPQMQPQGGGGGGGDTSEEDLNFFNQLTPGESLSPEQLSALEPQLAQRGMGVVRNASGRAGKIRLRSGEVVDVIQGAAGGLNKKNILRNDPKFGFGGGGEGGMAGGIPGMTLADYGNIMSQYGDFAKTGGFSRDDLANIRARATAPTRGIYARMGQEMGRQRALQGGYSPNFMAASAKMAREGSQQISDINRATEADIAEMTQRGRLAGLGGMAGLYGTTPGLASEFGRQALTAQGQGIDLAGLQNQLALGRMRAQQEQANIPGNWQQGMRNVGAGLDIAGDIGSMIYPWGE